MKVLFIKSSPRKSIFLVHFSKDVTLSQLQGLEFVQKDRDKTGGRLGEMLNRLKERGIDHQIISYQYDTDKPDFYLEKAKDYKFKYKLSNGKLS